MSYKKHLRRLNWLAKYSKRFADTATLPYGLSVDYWRWRRFRRDERIAAALK